jgi:DNA-binding transcriptional LysR family regulator
MDLEQLREFIVLAEHLNFSEAAKVLYTAQPVLSRHIAALEQQLGVQLFIRTKHSVQLTTIGQLFLEESRAILARYEEALQKIHLAASGLTGCVKIGFLDAAAKSFLAPFAVQFNHVHPNIQLQLFSFDYLRELIHALKRNELDIGFTLSVGVNNDVELNWQPLYCDFVSAVVRHDHPLANETSIDLSQIAQEPLLMPSRNQFLDGYEHVLKIYQSIGITPTIASESSRLDTLLLMVEIGLGIAILPRHTQIYASPNIRYIDLKGDECRFDVVVAWKKTSSNPAILPLLKELEANRNALCASYFQKLV